MSTYEEDRKTITTELEVKTGTRLAFSVEWLHATTEHEGEPVEIEMTGGAGVGSPYASVSIKKGDGPTHHYQANMGDWLQAFVKARLAEGLPEDDKSTGIVMSRPKVDA